MALNPNDAPEGFIAVENKDCHGCAFLGTGNCDTTPECYAWDRQDGCSVIYVANQHQAPRPTATANFPHDDMGTY